MAHPPPDAPAHPAARGARHTALAMDPSRKRKTRFVTALTAAIVLAGALVYTSFSAASEARTPSQLLVSAKPGRVYQLTGKVVPGYTRSGTVTNFRVRDRSGSVSVPVRYDGALPDPFREGREVIVDVSKQGTVFVGQKDSLVTKCPSKFSADQSKS
jgi:cytochrome c-type biogenesis protein CcmE